MMTAPDWVARLLPYLPDHPGPRPDPGPPGTSLVSEETTAAAGDPERPEAAARAVLTRLPMDTSGIEILVEASGVVRLSGVAGSARARLLAEEVVAALPGVVDVHNELTLEDRPDRDIAAGLSTVLAAGIDGDVENGEVTLTGEAPGYSAKRAAEDITLLQSGVRGVVNRLRVS